MADPTSDTGDDPGTPRWVKMSGIIGGVLVALIVVMLLAGHGPGRHLPGGHMPAGHLPLPSATEGTVGSPAPPNGAP
jgi:hypothetical protein